MQAAGMRFGNHTVHHMKLHLITEKQQRSEIFDAQRDLEKQLGIKLVSLAYPGDKRNDITVRLTKEAGYPFAVTTIHKIPIAGDNPLLLPRLRMKENTDLAKLLPL
jgi:peptidoglycan/xylan/chitin deacetylase (PgdA/CDA1 family)